MKKGLIIAVAIAGLSVSAQAQKSAIRTANNHLSYKEYEQAKKAIEGALADPSTKDDPKAWYTRGNIYFEMQQADQFKADKLYKEAAKSYIRAAELGSKEDDLNNRLYASVIYYFNDARKDYNDKQYQNAYEGFGGVVQIAALDGGTRFSSIKQMDTVVAEAKALRAYSAYSAKDYTNAITAFEEVKMNPISRDANLYLVLSDMYRQQGNDSKLLATLDEGRKFYPDNQNLRNEELNYYIRTGKQAELIGKLEQAVLTDPSNAELLFNLGNGYMNMAFPKSGSGVSAASGRPSNYDSLVAKAERSFMSAVRISQNNADYSYNLGALYFNQAAEVNKQINSVSGNSVAEQRKVEALRVQRDNFFNKSVPFLERSYALIDIKGAGMTEQERETYQQSLFALREVYLRTNQAEKAAEAKKKYDASMNRWTVELLFAATNKKRYQ